MCWGKHLLYEVTSFYLKTKINQISACWSALATAPTSASAGAKEASIYELMLLKIDHISANSSPIRYPNLTDP